jgi:hypothetical protein
MQVENGLASNNFVNTIPYMKNKGGRPTRDPAGAADQAILMRVTATEKAAYERIADGSGVSLSEWIRGLLNRAVKRESKRG